MVDDAYVLRRYDTLTAEGVAAEHRLLEALSSLDLPFAVPVQIRSLDGRTEIDQLALFPHLPGEPANFSHLALAGATLHLPKQIVHGDWAFGNMLVEDGRVTAALDFEIAGLTARVNDIVAAFYGCLDVTDPNTDADQVQTFCLAYLRRVDLTDAERDAFPELLRLRAFGRCVWLAGRWRRGQTSLNSVADALAEGLRLEEWLATTPNPLRHGEN